MAETTITATWSEDNKPCIEIEPPLTEDELTEVRALEGVWSQQIGQIDTRRYQRIGSIPLTQGDTETRTHATGRMQLLALKIADRLMGAREDDFVIDFSAESAPDRVAGEVLTWALTRTLTNSNRAVKLHTAASPRV